MNTIRNYSLPFFAGFVLGVLAVLIYPAAAPLAAHPTALRVLMEGSLAAGLAAMSAVGYRAWFRQRPVPVRTTPSRPALVNLAGGIPTPAVPTAPVGTAKPATPSRPRLMPWLRLLLIPLFGAAIGAIGMHVISAPAAVPDPEAALVERRIQDCSSDRIELMMLAFQMLKTNAPRTLENTRVQVLDPVGARLAIPIAVDDAVDAGAYGSALQEGQRFYIKLKQLVDLGYHVHYDPAARIAMVRYGQEPACLTFSSADRSFRVVAYWSEDPDAFDAWWNAWTWVRPLLQAPTLCYADANLPAVWVEGDSEQLFVPVRVLAGALRAQPVNAVDFVTGGSSPGQRSDILIHVPDDVSSLTASPGTWDGRWNAPPLVAQKLRLASAPASAAAPTGLAASTPAPADQ